MSLEGYLQLINKHYSVPEDKKRRNDRIRTQVLDIIIQGLKQDELFKTICSREKSPAGSYFDGLKVTEANEYDINILLDLHQASSPELKRSCQPGYVEVKILSINKLNEQPNLAKFRNIKLFLDDQNYLNVDKVNSWFEGLMDKTYNNIQRETNEWRIMKPRKSGPAKTIRVEFKNWTNDYFDIDIVPCFFFEKMYWPGGFRENTNSYDSAEKSGFVIVPKPANNVRENSIQSRKWRPSFHYQERKIIDDLGKVKPAIRLIKILRDKEENLRALKSYFIKTVSLWECQKFQNNNNSLSWTFMEVLKDVHKRIKERNIPFFWDNELNLLESWAPIHYKNCDDRLTKIIKDIERDPKNICQIFATAEQTALGEGVGYIKPRN